MAGPSPRRWREPLWGKFPTCPLLLGKLETCPTSSTPRSASMTRILCTFAAFLAASSSASAQILSYPNPYLDYVYPAGARQGQAVTVELGGPGGLDGAKSILIDGPPGITVSDVKAV